MGGGGGGGNPITKTYNDVTGGGGVNSLNPMNPINAVRNDPWRAARGVYTFGTSEIAPKGWSDAANGITGGIFGGSGNHDGPGGTFYQDPGPKPGDPSGQIYINAANGQLDERAKLNPSLAAYSAGDQSAYNALKDRAMSQGPSAWANMQTQALKGQQQNAINNVNAQQAGNLANAQSNLAAHGGLTGGAAERLSRGGMRDMNASRQDITNQGIQGQNQIGIADDAQKTAALGNVGNMSMQYANAQNQANLANTNIQNNAQQQNVQTLLSEANKANAFNMDKYKTQMAQYGAANTANAIGGAPAAPGGKGGKK